MGNTSVHDRFTSGPQKYKTSKNKDKTNICYNFLK